MTTEPVLIEYLNYFAAWGAGFRRMACVNVNRFLASPLVRVLPLTRESFRAGVDLYAARPDKAYSLTDCISMTTMRREGLSEVLTNDRHFEQEGIRVVFKSD